ncbi:zinc finger protein 513 isoform X1 [Arapaima gigas]
MPRRKQRNPQPVKYIETLGNFVLKSKFLFGPLDNKIIQFSRDSDVEAALSIPVLPLTRACCTYSQLPMEGSLEEPHNDASKVERDSHSERVPFLSCRPRNRLLNRPLGDALSRGGTKAEQFGSTGDKVHSCELCSFSSRYANHVKRHMKTHNGEKPYQCLLCAYASAQLVNLQRHVRVHTGEKPYKCQHCAFACSSLGNLKRHQRMHAASERHHHTYCSSASNKREHEICVTSQRAVDRMPRATADGAGVSNLALHVKSDTHYLQSYNDRTNGHESSGLLYSGRTAHVTHGLTEFLFPYTCSLQDEGSCVGQTCSKCLTSATSSRCCVSPTALSDKPYSCAVCSFVTHYPNHLVRHMKTHSGEKPYRCSECDYASAHQDNLKRHHRVHTGEKPYHCGLCDYACGNLANLKRHQRVHSGAKPFKCAMCSYSCNQSMNLKRHMLRHTGEKPFTCRECPYTTGHWDNYKRHQKKHSHCSGSDSWVKVPLPHEESEDDKS